MCRILSVMAKFKKEQTATLQILFSLCLVCLLQVQQCSSQELNPVLTSTESTVTLEWNVEANATTYQVTWHRTVGFFFIDEYYEAPFPEDGKLVYRTSYLLPGVPYTFLLFRNGNLSTDRIFSGDIFTVPLPPENLAVLNRTSSSVLLTWEPGYNSTQSHYEVEYQADGSIQTEMANVTTDPLTFNLTNLMPGHTYLLSMRAVSGNKRSNNSVAVTAVTAPAMPQNLNVTATSTSMLLATWEPGNNSLQDSFEVRFSLAGESLQSNTSCTASPCEFSVGGVPGQLYAVSVYAVQQTFRSDPAVVEHNTAPASPRNLNGVGGVRTLQLTWEVPSQGVFDSFRVSLTNAFENIEMSYAVPKNGDEIAYSFSQMGLVGGVNYFVKVYSVTLTEDSKDSASHLYYTLPEPVTSLSGHALSTSAVQLSWQNPINSEYTGLELNVSTANGFEVTYSLNPGEGTFPVGGLTPGVEYLAVIVVKSKVQADSTAVNTTVRTKPESPQLATVDMKEDSITVTLTGGQTQGGLFDSISAKLVEDGTLMTADSSGVVKFPNLTPGTQYTLDAYTMSGVQTSESLTEVLYTKPRPPRNLDVQVITSDELLIMWQAPDKGGVDNYTLTLVAAHGAEVPMVHVVNGLTFSFTGAHPGETYNVSIVANKGTESSLVVVDQKTTNPESVAALQKVNATSDSITVNWTAPVSGSFNSFQLGIIPQDSPNSVMVVPSSQTENTFEGLRPGKNYTVAIRTVIGRNSYGVAVRLQAVTSPLPVVGLTVETLSADSLKVSWAVDNSSNQDRFTVLQDKDGARKSTQVDAVEGQLQYEVVLDQLLAGQSYTITVTAIREIDTDIEESLPQVQSGTTKPFPVTNVTVTENDQIVTVTWKAAAASRQESFLIRYRPTLRNSSSSWLEQTAMTQASQFSQAFPGEKYEISVLAISNGQKSDESNATVVIAPLPPGVSVDPATTTTTSVSLKWTHDPAATYVEHWMLTYRDSQTSQTVNVSFTGTSNDYVQMLTPLTSGVTYAVEVMAVVQGVMSEKVTLNATAKPTINTNIIEISSQTTSSQLAFEYRVTVSDVFDAFRFTLLDVSGVDPVVKSKDDRDHLVTFGGLNGGQVYTVQAVTVSAGEVSDPVTESILTNPNNVHVNFQNKSDQITVNFASLEGGATKYGLVCRTPSNTSCWDEVVTVDTNSIIINNLVPYTTYSIVVTTTAGGTGVFEKSVSQSYEVDTLEAAPSVVRQVIALEDGLRTVQLSWTPPVALNGVLRSYRLEYTGVHLTAGQDSQEQNQIPASTTNMMLTDLKAGYTYTFKVQAMTVAFGPAGETTLILSTSVPVFKAGSTADNSKPTKAESGVVSETSVSVQLLNAFSDNNGPILGYTVIVSTDPSAVTAQQVLPSWSDARGDPSIVAYQATDKCSDLFLENSSCGKPSSRTRRAVSGQDSMVFQLGLQSVEQCGTIAFCNGPLEAETDYYVKLRAFTQSGFTDTEYSSKIRTADAPKSSMNVIVGAVVGVLVIVIIGIVAVIIVIRIKRRPKRATKYRGAPGARTSWESSSLKNFRESGIRRFREVRDRVGQFAMHLLHVNSGESEENSSFIFDRKFYRTFDRHVSRPVKLRDFPEHVQKMAADSDFKYAEEYEDLKEVGRDQTCYAAELPVNRPKNRFTNILPYDHSRVKLLPTDDEDGSDYINANYMPGYISKREYIATQGPLPATRDDFWRMVWEQNVRNIVMLTRCMEKGREKSDHYWPSDSEPKFYGDFQVVVLNETHLPDWTITEFRMCLGDNCRQVRHFHYKAWPDFGVPKNHSSLIRFVRTVREKLIKEGGPIVTHCSAGVGRSGTFIVLDHCLRLMRERDEVDIFSIVYNLRRERVLMVQTEQQYKFIHECLACVLEGREDEATYANLGQVNVGFEDDTLDIPIPLDLNRKSSLFLLFDDEGINVEVPT